jgi:hypothetical protein
VGGNLTFGGRTQPILNAKLRGDQLQFSYVDRNGNLTSVSLTFNESKVKGVENSGYMAREFSGYLQ